MRKSHYQPALDGLGVRTWDHYDPDATHFVCFADGVAVASMRSAADRVGSGEASGDFPGLAAHLPRGTIGYLYLSRLLVVPAFRCLGLTAVIMYMAAAWWKSNSALDYVLASAKEPAAGARNLGAKVLAGPVRLGPDQVPILLVGVSLSALAGRAKSLLDRLGWLEET